VEIKRTGSKSLPRRFRAGP